MLDTFKDFVARLLNIYRAPAVCKGCIAHIEHIESLESQLRREQANRDDIVALLTNQLETARLQNFEVIKHMTGMNRVAAPATSEMHSVRRPNNSIASRIAKAEAADREQAQELSAKRRKDYEDRTESLLKSVNSESIKESDPSVTIVGDIEDAVQESRAEQIQESERTEIQ